MSASTSDTLENSAVGGVNQMPPTPLFHTYIPATSCFEPTMAITITVLVAAFFLMGFFALYIRKCARARPDTGQQRPGGASQARSKSRGLAKEVVEALPVAHFKDLGEKGDVECPVCLSHFEAEDSLRKLPHCNHVFHLDCIDLWLVSHSTCPLCRASLLPDGSDGIGKGDGAAEQENGVMEVPREVVGSVDVAAEVLVVTGLVRTPSELPVEEESGAPGPVITRGDERDSARDSLRRNALSFMRAVRGVAALEMVASPLRGEKPPKLPTPTNLSLQRSSSLGTDSKSLRNYSMNSEGTLRGINFHVGTASEQGISSAQILSTVVSNAHVSGSPLAKLQDHWVTIDLERETSRSKPPLPRSSLPTGTARVISRPEKWSFNNLRGVLPLSRSSSDLMQQDQHPPV